MLTLVPEKISHYIESYYDDVDPLLREMQRYGESRDFPLIGPQVGRLLFILTKLVRAKRIFEFGSGYGYSAYWFAKALPSGGVVYQTDRSEENSQKSREFFKKGGLTRKTKFLVGNAIKLFDQTPGHFDIILFDLDKQAYSTAFQKAKNRLRRGGLMIADNTLWSGRVLDKNPDDNTQGIQSFTQLLFKDKAFFSMILPIRDGVAVGLKL